MAETKRGRISKAAYMREVGRMFTRDWFALDASEILTQFELVDYLVSAEPRRYWSKGQAVRVLLDRSIEHVIAHIQKSDDKSMNRVAEFLKNVRRVFRLRPLVVTGA